MRMQRPRNTHNKNHSRFNGSQEQDVSTDTDLAAVLDAFPEDERADVVDHLRDLSVMSPQKRSAVLALTRT